MEPSFTVILINKIVVALLLYAGVVGTLLTLVPEETNFHGWVQRNLLPSALTIVSIIIAVGIITGGMVGFIIARSAM